MRGDSTEHGPVRAQPDSRRTEQTRHRYDRFAPFYDPMEILAELQYRRWRARLWADVGGPEVLEVGVGTGRNLPYHPAGVHVVAIDLSPRMLQRARRVAARTGSHAELRIGDVQTLEFEDASFDEATGSFVFCSVPDPILGLREIRRVLKPGGQLHLLEHVRARNSAVARAMDFANPLVVRATGVNINRETANNVATAGFAIERDEALGLGGVFRLIVARSPAGRP